MNKKDFGAVMIIGAGVGLLIQPILANNLPHGEITWTDRGLVFLFFLIIAPLALWIASLIAKIWKGVYQFAQFAAVGSLNTFIDVGVFNLETFLYGPSIVGTGIFAAFKAISFLCATTNSYVWNKYWTFNSRENARVKEVGLFYLVAAIGWGLNVGFATLVKVLGPADSRTWVNLIAPLSGVVASFLWDFLGYKYLVFRTRAARISVART